MKKWFLILLVIGACQGPDDKYIVQQANTESLLIGLSVIDENIVWASGANGTVLRTFDGGDSWKVYQHPTGDTLQFRDIHALDKNNAVVLSIGSGASSRIFKFDSREWTETFVMDHPNGFLDCIDFWDVQRGIAYGDSFDGFLYILFTDDGGQTWNRILPDSTLIAGFEEGGFASSGTNIELGAYGQAWIGTGAGGNARILYTSDYGKSWQSRPTPMVTGPAAGITSVRFVDDRNGFITGGDLLSDSTFQRNLFITSDGGASWTPTAQPETRGAFYGSAYQLVQGSHVLIVNGPNGADISQDRGASWTNLSTDNLWTSELLPNGVGWLMGKNGKIIKIKLK